MVANHLGADRFGELNYGMTMGLIGAGLAQLGLDSLVTRQIARHHTAGDHPSRCRDRNQQTRRAGCEFGGKQHRGEDRDYKRKQGGRDRLRVFPAQPYCGK